MPNPEQGWSRFTCWVVGSMPFKADHLVHRQWAIRGNWCEFLRPVCRDVPAATSQQPYVGSGDRIDPLLCEAPQYLGDYQIGLSASDGARVARGSAVNQLPNSGTGATYNPVYGGEGQAANAGGPPKSGDPGLLLVHVWSWRYGADSPCSIWGSGLHHSGPVSPSETW